MERKKALAVLSVIVITIAMYLLINYAIDITIQTVNDHPELLEYSQDTLRFVAMYKDYISNPLLWIAVLSTMIAILSLMVGAIIWTWDC